MLAIPGIDITDAVLTSNSVSETVAAYNAGTTYAKDVQVRSDTTHHVYQSAQAGNTGHALTDTAWWVDIGPTNPWAAFDYYRNTVTTASMTIAWEFTIAGRVNSISLLGLEGVTSVTIVAEKDGDEVYNEIFTLNSSDAVVGWWSYFFTPISTADVLFVTDLPPERDMVLTVTLSGSGTIGCGICSIGTSMFIGDAQYGAGVSIYDYGYKKTDQFGDYEYVRRGYSLQNDYTVTVTKSATSKIVRDMKELRGKPIVWIGHADYGCTYNFGPYTDFKLQISYPYHSVYTFRIEGLA